MTRRLDFDAFRRERTGEPVVVSVAGVDYLLPATLPAATALDIIALQRDTVVCDAHAAFDPTCDECKGPDVTPEQLFDLAHPLFGPGVLRRIAAEADLSVDELGALIQHTFELYNSEAAPAPNRAARRATKATRAEAKASGSASSKSGG